MYTKEIAYDRETRDFAYSLNGELCGFAATYSAAEARLDALVYDLLSEAAAQQPEPTPPAAPELPAGLRIADETEPGWTYRLPGGARLWVTDAPPLDLAALPPAPDASTFSHDPDAWVAVSGDEPDPAVILYACIFAHEAASARRKAQAKRDHRSARVRAYERAVAALRRGARVTLVPGTSVAYVTSATVKNLSYRLDGDACCCPASGACWHQEAVRIEVRRLRREDEAYVARCEARELWAA